MKCIIKIIFIILAFAALVTQYVWNCFVGYEKAIDVLLKEVMDIQEKSRGFSRFMRRIPIVGGWFVHENKLPCNLESVFIKGNGGIWAMMMEKDQLKCLESFTRKTLIEMLIKLRSDADFSISQFMVTLGLFFISVGLTYSIMAELINKVDVQLLKKNIDQVISNIEESERLTKGNNDKEILKDEIGKHNADEVTDEVADKSNQKADNSREESKPGKKDIFLNESTLTTGVTQTLKKPNKENRDSGTQWSGKTEMPALPGDNIEDAQSSKEKAENNGNSEKPRRDPDNDYYSNKQPKASEVEVEEEEEEVQVGTQSKLPGVQHQGLYSKFSELDILYRNTKEFHEILVLKKENWDVCTLTTTREEFTWIMSCPEETKNTGFILILRGISRIINLCITALESKGDKDDAHNTQVLEKVHKHEISSKPSPAAVADRNRDMWEKAKNEMQSEIADEKHEPFSRYSGSDEVVLYRNNGDFLEIRLLKLKNKCWQKFTVETSKQNKKLSQLTEAKVGTVEKCHEWTNKKPNIWEILESFIEKSRSKRHHSYGNRPTQFSEKGSSMFEKYFSWYMTKKKSKLNGFTLVKKILKFIRKILDAFKA